MCLFYDVLCEASTDPSATCCGINHPACIAYVVPETDCVRFQVRRGIDCSVHFCHVGDSATGAWLHP
jgi:hypothetical protein